jgi:N-acetylmuramoyl-L-alanine amidase
VACGLTRQGEWLTYACTDGSADASTPEDLRDELAAMNLETAIINDGGRKVNLYIREANILWEGKDPSQNLILIWLKKEEGEDMSDKKIFTVVLDAGHDAGNLANASPDQTYYEHEFALDMTKRIKAVLEASSRVKVVETRPDGAAVDLDERCAIEKASGADLFVSLHSNAASVAEGWGTARGWKALIYGLNGARYAAAKAILARVEGISPAMRKPPIDAAPGYYVLKHTKAPALLIEHGFHTNQEDVKLLKDPTYRQKLAYAEAAGILDWLGIPVPEFAPEKTEAEQAVDWITGAGIMLGNTSGDLMLDQPLTRKQFAVMLYRYNQQQK